MQITRCRKHTFSIAYIDGIHGKCSVPWKLASTKGETRYEIQIETIWNLSTLGSFAAPSVMLEAFATLYIQKLIFPSRSSEASRPWRPKQKKFCCEQFCCFFHFPINLWLSPNKNVFQKFQFLWSLPLQQKMTLYFSSCKMCFFI